MHIVFINYNGFDSPSAMHIFHLANALADIKVRCTVYNYREGGKAELYGSPKFRMLQRCLLSPARLAAELSATGEDYVLHSWTPRESARGLTLSLLAEHPAPYVVHMEDNEEAIYATLLEHLSPEVIANPASSLPGGILHSVSDPVRYKEFIAQSQGCTSIIESLQDFNPVQVPGHVFWPACEDAVFALPRKSRAEDKARWGLPEDCVSIFYPGNVHLNNLHEVMELYCAVGFLCTMGIKARIIKFGRYVNDLPGEVFSHMECPEALLDLTNKITQAQIPEVMRAADILVQPGRDNPFNHYRFPCKLPMFMASGRPVILPNSNLGHSLTHGENCLLLQEGGAEEILANILLLIRKPALASSIGAAGRIFAREHFNWAKSAAGLKVFYEEVLERWKGR